MSDRIRVSGYSQKTFFNNQVEYRNFSPDLVGIQLAADGGTPLFTMGNFAITTNFDPKRDKTFTTKKFSNFVTLTDLNLTLNETLELLTNNAGVILNLDKRNLSNYALFGSFVEFIRVALENIITNWPAALYINPIYAKEPLYLTQTGYTAQNYIYDNITDTSSFSISTNVINNKFSINYLKNGNLQGTFNSTNELRNLTLNYRSYSLLINNKEYDLIDFTGSTDNVNDAIYITVKGNPFTGQNVYDEYYIKPNKLKENSFYNSLPNFEYYLLNRLVTPKFTANFNFTIKSDAGDILYVNDSVTWPTTDGYNIDFDTEQYDEYASKLLEISTDFDITTSNLMIRFLVTESITDFDTTAVHLDPLDQDTSGQKMNKTLNLYGLEFDKINLFIKGIQFANTVSYDKNNNTPDIYLKNIARVMGWDLVSSVLENNLLQSYIHPKETTFSGQTVGLTAVEADIELWRRIILNTPWIWKSKGTRKAIEFLFKFIGTPLGLISFNEYVYLAENKIDIDVFQEALRLNGLDDTLSNYPVDNEGYPSPLLNTSEMYFQGNGLWYRETGGDNATIDVTSGNNPHAGPYDGGYKYINQFRQLIPNFSSVTISSQTVTTETTNLFTNYVLGTMTTYTGDTYVDITTADGSDFTDCYVVKAEIVEDPKHRQDLSNCDCEIPSNLKSLSICIDKTGSTSTSHSCQDSIGEININTQTGVYEFGYYQYNIDGSIYSIGGEPILYRTNFVPKECCNYKFTTPFFYNELDTNGQLINSGYICCNYFSGNCGCLVTCKWTISDEKTTQIGGAIEPTDPKYLVFKTELGDRRITSENGCNCIQNYTIPVPVSAGTNDVGVACQLTQLGLSDIQSNDSIIIKTYNDRANGLIPCDGVSTIQNVTKIYGVALTSNLQSGKRINNLEYVDTTSQTVFIGNNYNNTNIPLSGNAALNTGYYQSVSGTGVTPLQGDTIRMQIQKPTLAGVDIEFNPSIGHRMLYMISNVEYTDQSFINQVNALNQVTVYETIVNGVQYYYADIPYSSSTNETYVYLVWDFNNSIPLNNTFYITNTNTSVPTNRRITVTVISSGQSTTIYNGPYMTEITGTNPVIPLSNAIVILEIYGARLYTAACNGQPASINGTTNTASWTGVNGPLVIGYLAV